MKAADCSSPVRKQKDDRDEATELPRWIDKQ